MSNTETQIPEWIRRLDALPPNDYRAAVEIAIEALRTESYGEVARALGRFIERSGK